MGAITRSISAWTLCLAATPGLAAEETTEGENVKILLTFGGHKFEEEAFFAMFDALPGVEYVKAPMPESADLLKPGLEKDYDAIVMYDMVKSISEEQRKAFVELLEAGIGVVSMHHNLCAHGDWDEYAKIIGGKYLRGPEILEGREYEKSTFSHGQDVQVTAADKEHFITKGLADFTIHDETYGGYYVSSEVHVLLKTDHPTSEPEIAWTKRYGQSRVFYYALGHDAKAWANPNYPEILRRGILWAAKSED
jgi:type 1 glutamine amidotransferase